MASETNGHGPPRAPATYIVRVPKSFIYVSLLTSILVAFTIGRAARIILIEGPRQALLAPHDSSAMFVRPDHSKPRLPNPKLIEGKEVPKTLYTAKNFDSGAIGASSSSAYLERSGDSMVDADTDASPFCKADEDGKQECLRSASGSANIKMISNDTEDEEHHPAGQHLLVDIKNVDGTFLNSELRLAEAMISVVNESRLTLLSYHCHKLVPMGVSCVGVLLESHISFHTWPAEGVITLDLFTCGSGELVPVLPIVERLFAVQIEGEVEDMPLVVWSHKLRGFAPGNSPLGDDLGQFVLERTYMDFKVEVASTITKFQRIDIYDSINAKEGRNYLSYTKSLTNDGSYESLHPELLLPEREVYLDGVLQSTRYGNEPYHEALVHPAAFAHPNPKRIAIIGGGEGATLREALKHNSVETVVMIEIDGEMVSVSREHLPDWNTCSDIEGSTDWCGDDPRSVMRYEDGMAWFDDRFSDEKKNKSEKYQEDPFDILIMDALDPQDDIVSIGIPHSSHF